MSKATVEKSAVEIRSGDLTKLKDIKGVIQKAFEDILKQSKKLANICNSNKSIVSVKDWRRYAKALIAEIGLDDANSRTLFTQVDMWKSDSLKSDPKPTDFKASKSIKGFITRLNDGETDRKKLEKLWAEKLAEVEETIKKENAKKRALQNLLDSLTIRD